jgi:opacity protein-like surface antigen
LPAGRSGRTPIPSHTKYNLAWAVMAGLAFDLGYGFKLDAGYRFVHVGDARTGVDTFGVGSKAKALDAQEVRVGVRYVID